MTRRLIALIDAAALLRAGWTVEDIGEAAWLAIQQYQAARNDQQDNENGDSDV